MANVNHPRAHVWISGRVQGVGYRMSTCQAAETLGVNGWVKNLPDGRVEAVFEGPPELLEEMIRWCHKGPQMAIVQEVKVEYEEPEEIQGFHTSR
ncbi:acylphosphatase [Trichocoleus sp. FACHB-591]|uniref:acylphosphatase n=1 Tax=unclassified Trichocoleus TaxID=2628910 RepID=UPI001682A501|nr:MULTISPECIES: acylphosphatase [unclassified Trichocoleus]MBD2094627.1 acylphosphatase [Trichocoleus sp. FACHB-591]MBD2120089.1 acylphosphatase [Trichocoleus sp. FACHB-262]